MNGNLQEALYSLCLHGLIYKPDQSTSMGFRVGTRVRVVGHRLGGMGYGFRVRDMGCTLWVRNYYGLPVRV